MATALKTTLLVLLTLCALLSLTDRLDGAATCPPPVPPRCPPGHTACFLADRSAHFCCKRPGTCPCHPPETLADAGCIVKPGEPVRSPEGPSLLYVWAGPREWKGNDFLAVFELDPRNENYGKLLCVSEIDTSGNEAHHMGLSADRKTLIVGGLFSMIKKQPDVYFFNVSANATCPPYVGSLDVPDASAADDWKPLPEGGFVGTMMGSANGSTPGGVVKFSGGTPDSYEGVFPQRGGQFVGAEE
ncbi:hypothetical protein KFL_005740030 [Klebsormidium nitens]|uniref:Uncharacterized protein n=1 Tax=Klebsormidium nitens TaxID=105231 RepID=A0A1Y1IIJ3_KLENI|nr:hypothetical protein KFL_005740030 [Klebsormidium nitens]|eukprot:GAQ89892.1 hypothetical protein KFL_005740030 [Klebsormidium nitens]